MQKIIDLTVVFLYFFVILLQIFFLLKIGLKILADFSIDLKYEFYYSIILSIFISLEVTIVMVYKIRPPIVFCLLYPYLSAKFTESILNMLSIEEKVEE